MSLLFSAFKLGALELESRIVIPPMCQYSAENGFATAWHAGHYGMLAHSGAGLLIVEATAVTPEGRISPWDLGLWSEEHAETLKPVLAAARFSSPIPIAVQLAHAGRKASTAKPWEGGGQIAPQDGGWRTVAPSAVDWAAGCAPPAELSKTAMADIRAAFAASAALAAQAGFDGVELHCAHGYLLHQFLSPLSNRRGDEYGGTLENRLRFPLEVFQAVREAFPAHKPVWVRLSATDWMDGGWDVEQSLVFAERVKALGCAALHVSSGGLVPEQKIVLGPDYQVPFADYLKKHSDMPVIAVGLITSPEQAEAVLVNNRADLVAIGRAVLYDPRWPWHAAAALGDSVRPAPQYARCRPHALGGLFK